MNTQTQTTKIFKLNLAVVFVFLLGIQALIAQNNISKLSKEFKVTPNSVIELKASHTDIVFKTWNKDIVSINAFIQPNDEATNPQEHNQLLKLWNLKVNQNDSILTITSDASQKQQQTVSTFHNISGNLSQYKIKQLMQAIMAPLLKNVQSNPIPASLKNSLDQLKFDYTAYNKLGNTYLKMWEHNLVKNLDSKSATEVKKWSKKATTNLQQASNNYNNSEKENQTTSNYNIEFFQSYTANSVLNKKTNNVIEISIPIKAKLKFKTRYGKVIVFNKLVNAKAEMKYTTLKAEKISGKNSDFIVSFAPIEINYWENGTLTLGYVKKTKLNKIDNIKLNNNSSKVTIGSIQKGAIVESLFGIIDILNLSTDFKKLTLVCKNSDIGIKLPPIAYNFAYNGERSFIQIPKNRLNLNTLNSNYSQMINGYSISRSTKKEIQMSVVNTEVLLK